MCELCGEREATVYDHNHDTGMIRGKLCHACNLGMGALDRAGWLAKALIYKSRPDSARTYIDLLRERDRSRPRRPSTAAAIDRWKARNRERVNGYQRAYTARLKREQE
jgi:hypothetical protein